MFSVCLSTCNHLLCFRPFQAWNNAAQKPQRRFAPRALPRFIATIAPSDSCPGPDRFRLCLGEATGGHAVRLRVAPAPRQVSRVALSFCPAGTAKPSGPSRRPRRSPMPFAPVARHAVSTFVRCAKTRPADSTISRLLWVHWCYGPPVRHRHALRGWRPNPTYLNAPVARTRPVGRYTLNRQLAWKAPFILQDREHLCSAYAHLGSATKLPPPTSCRWSDDFAPEPGILFIRAPADFKACRFNPETRLFAKRRESFLSRRMEIVDPGAF